jgi:hypothetical protein
MTKWKFFIPVSIIAASLLLMRGAPISAVILGIVLGGWMIRRAGQRTARSSR